MTRRLPTNRPPTHPGEMLAEEFLTPAGESQSAFARRIGVSFPRLHEILHAKRGVTIDTALRIAQATGTAPQFWLNMQQDWDLWHALRAESAKAVKKIVPLAVA